MTSVKDIGSPPHPQPTPLPPTSISFFHHQFTYTMLKDVTGLNQANVRGTIVTPTSNLFHRKLPLAQLST